MSDISMSEKPIYDVGNFSSFVTIEEGEHFENLSFLFTGTEEMNVNTTLIYSNETIFHLIIKYIVHIFGISAIFLNVGFLIAMCGGKPNSNKDSSFAFHCFVKCLSIADILSSIAFLMAMDTDSPLNNMYPQGETFFLQQGLPYIIRGVPWLFFTAYFLTLTCLSVNQYIAVCWPLNFDNQKQKVMVKCCVIIVCSISSCQVLVPLIVSLSLQTLTDVQHAQAKLNQISKIEMEVWMCVFLLSTAANIILNSLVYRTLGSLKWKRQRANGTSNNLNHVTANVRAMHRAFVTICILLFTAILLRLPFPIVSIISLELGHAKINWSIFQIVNHFVIFLLFTNFFADPIIYITRMRQARDCLQSTSPFCARACSRSQRRSEDEGIDLRLMPDNNIEKTEETSIVDSSRRNGSVYYKPDNGSNVPPDSVEL